MHSIFQKGDPNAPVLVLLHGTGGNEHSLLALGKKLDGAASVLSIRGNILEGGMPRFFRRLAEGVYDEQDLAFRGEELSQFIKEAGQKHAFTLKQVVLVGYSNGANIAVHLLLHEPTIYQTAILFHPMFPVADLPKHSLAQTRALMTLGEHDPIVPVSESRYVIQLFEERQAVVKQLWTDSHQLTLEEVAAARDWLRNN